MSFILSWRGFFKRKRRDPRLWAEANNVDSYERCVKLLNKMCLREPTFEEYTQEFAPLAEEKIVAKPASDEVESTQPTVTKDVPPKVRKVRTPAAKSPVTTKKTATKKPPAKEEKPETTTRKRAPRKRSTTTRSRSRKSSTKDGS